MVINSGGVSIVLAAFTGTLSAGFCFCKSAPEDVASTIEMPSELNSRDVVCEEGASGN